MLRFLLGLIKGAAVGVAVGGAAYKLGIGGGALAYVVCGLTAGLAGIVCGKPLWRQETLWTPLLKGVVGFLVGLGLYWVARKALGGASLAMATDMGAPDRPLVEIPFLVAPLIAMIYGIFVEVDDAGTSAGKPAAPPAAGKPAVRS